jgi:hypothetical protein
MKAQVASVAQFLKAQPTSMNLGRQVVPPPHDGWASKFDQPFNPKVVHSFDTRAL